MSVANSGSSESGGNRSSSKNTVMALAKGLKVLEAFSSTQTELTMAQIMLDDRLLLFGRVPRPRTRIACRHGGFPDGATIENGHITMPELPGIGFEGKDALNKEMRSLME